MLHNKVILVSSDQVEVIKKWVDHHIHRIRIIETTLCYVQLEILLAVGSFDPEQNRVVRMILPEFLESSEQQS